MIEVVKITVKSNFKVDFVNYWYFLRCSENKKYFSMNLKNKSSFILNSGYRFNKISSLIDFSQNAQLIIKNSNPLLLRNILEEEIIISFPNLNKLRGMKESHPEYFI